MPEIRTILHPTDFSESSGTARHLACALARDFGARLVVAYAYPPPLNMAEVVDRGRPDGIEDDLLAKLKHLVPDDRTVTVEYRAVEGRPAEAILRTASDEVCDLIVMGTHGRSGLRRAVMGSVADALVRQATIPVLLVRPQKSASDLAREQALRRILIPVDGSDLAEQVLEPALALGAAAQAEYTLLRVVEQLTPASYDPASGRVSGLNESLLRQLQAMDRQHWTEAQDYLERLAERLRARSLTVQTRVVSHQQPAAAILDDAQKNAFDLIALATQGRGGLKRLLLGSVADKVVRGATIPVLVYRPVAKSAPAEK